MMVAKNTIRKFSSSFNDRRDSYDDGFESDIFVRFLAKHIFPSYKIVEKPRGTYGVDIWVESEKGTVIAAFDLERCGMWEEDWPTHWKSLSFLSRKTKFMDAHPEFGMVWFNNALSKFVIAWKKDIERFPDITTHLNTGEVDRVRRIDFGCGTLFGPAFAPRETALFSHRIVCAAPR